ncbi:MAG: right-handed parallel beta-helix repeat-containing protein, partial [Bacteroidales bacterium]
MKTMKNLILCALTLCFVFMLSCKKDDETENNDKSLLFVPGDYSSIQAAINASSDGDTIMVDPGTYKENINFNGKEVIVQSCNPEDQGSVETTIIDGNGEGTVVTFDSGETESAVLNGFTIINGDAGTSNGGGILITNSSNPVVKNNTITGNEAKYGAGICVSGESQPSFINNIIKSNTAAGSRGAGIYVIGMSSVTIDNNVFKDHIDCDGVIHIGSTSTDECDAVITNNTIENNTTSFGTGGI